MSIQAKKKLAVIVFTVFAVFDFLLVLIATPTTVSAAAECTLNNQHGWHIVGGGQNSEHWYETLEECQAALIPTEEPTETATEPPTEEPTETATVTPDPTETVTVTPDPTETVTVTPSPTETTSPTPEVTASPTVTPEVTETPVATISPTPDGRRMTCYTAWYKIQNNVHKDEGYRFFDNPEHAYCQVWLWNKYGVDYNYYKFLHP